MKHENRVVTENSRFRTRQKTVTVLPFSVGTESGDSQCPRYYRASHERSQPGGVFQKLCILQ